MNKKAPRKRGFLIVLAWGIIISIMLRFEDIITDWQQIFPIAMSRDVAEVVISIAPLILCLILYLVFWPLWKNYMRSKFIFETKHTLLEIKLPKDVFKSPLSMEVFLNAINNTADGNFFGNYWKSGEKRPIYSLEIVSIEGRVRFFIRTEDRRKGGVTAPLYSQYPGIEINEVEDYTKPVHFDPKVSKMWAAEFVFTKPESYPIKTYVDYGLDKDPKEEYKVDPLLPMIEFLGSVGPNQQVWIQYIIRAHKDDQDKPGTWFGKTDTWKDSANAEIDKIMKRDPKTKVAGTKSKDSDRVVPPSLSDGEKEIVAALGRSIAKPAFDVGIRAMYLAPKDTFQTQFGVGGILASFKQFGTENLNGLKQNSSMWIAQFKGVPWEDFRGWRRAKYSKFALDAFKRRSYFDPPWNDGKPLVLNTEELATLFHFPGQVSTTPTLDRVPSKKGQAPANIPI